MEKLRGANEKIPFSHEMVQEYFKCAEDIVYFAEKYFYIVNIDEGKHRISLYDYQKKALKIFLEKEYDGRKNCIVLMPRQQGKCFFSSTEMSIRNRVTGEIQIVNADYLYSLD